jgi:hypothetical protein
MNSHGTEDCASSRIFVAYKKTFTEIFLEFEAGKDFAYFVHLLYIFL